MNDYFWMNKMAGYQNASSSLPATSAWGVNHMSMPFPTTPSSSVQQRDTPWKSAGHSHYRTNTTPSSDLDTFWTYPGGWAEPSLAETLGDGSEEVSAVIADKPTATPGEAPSSCSLARQAASRPSGPAKITGKRMEKPSIITGELNSESNGSPVKRRRGQPLGDVTNGQATDNYLQQAPNADKPRQNEALASMPAGMHFLLELLNYRKKIRAPVIVSQVCRLLLFRRGLLDEDEQQIFDDFVAKDRSGLVEGAVQRSLSASHLMVLEASQYIHLGCNHELVEVSAGRQLRALIGVPDQADPFYAQEQAVLDWDEHNECFAESQT
ncbi:hypothetical protein CF326_g7971 [Tilletia indica]|nr:hypothetical protein CF326_g7971 [Tilletia indica]